MSASGPVRLLPPIPPAIRFALAGFVVAMLVYGMMLLEPSTPGDAGGTQPAEVVVPVPELDRRLLAGARDGTRTERLLLEPEPLAHLLQRAIDVGPSVAAALGIPATPVPVAALRAAIADWRLRWLWYEGRLEQLTGPRPGHPLAGYSIFEATIRLADGERVFAAFSVPPDPSIRPGGWVRVEGYLLKLRDTTYPSPIEAAPYLVGRSIARDYEDWPPVTTLDPAVLAKVDDSSYWPGDKAWHDLEEDQTEALWHLAAFARDGGAGRTLADWRRIGTLNTHDVHQRLVAGEIERGTPMRVFGTLIRRSTIAAGPNPAGVQFWTEAWLQVREYGGGVLVPVWVPRRVDALPERAQLEVRGYFYRWRAYETRQHERRRVPLFVAADLDLYQLEVDKTMRTIGLWLAGGVCALLALLWWSQRRDARRSVEHLRDLDSRRRRRRQRTAPAADR